MLGIWKDFEEMEWTLTVEELQHILNAKSRQDMRTWRFQASLKGINLDDPEGIEEGSGNGQQKVADKIKEIEAKRLGIDHDANDFAEIGIAMETE